MIKRGDIYYADLGNGVGSEQKGVRPVLIIQNDTGNLHSPTVIIASITSKMTKAKLPTHVDVGEDNGLPKNSIIMLEQVRTIDKKRLTSKITTLDQRMIRLVNRAISVSVGL